MVPYRDIFDHKGPLLYFINALGDFIGGFRGIGLIEILFYAGFLYLLWKSCKLLDVSRQNFALVAVFIPFLLCPVLVGGNLTEEYALPFLAFGNYYLIKMFTVRKVENKDSFLLGVSAAALICLRPNMAAPFFIIAPAIIYCTLFQERDWKLFVKTVFCGLAGLGVIFLPFFLYFYSASALQDAYFCIFKFNIAYSAHEESVYDILRLMLDRVCRNQYLFIPCALSFLLLFIPRQKRRGMCFFLFLVTAASVFSCVFSRSEYEHYWVVLIPLYALLLAMTGMVMNCALNQKTYTALFCCLLLLSGVFSVSKTVEYKANAKKMKREFREFATFFENHLNGERKTLVLGNECYLYHLLKLQPDFKYVYQDPVIRFSPEIRSEFMHSIEERRYEYIIVPVKTTLQSEYETVKRHYSPALSNRRYRIYQKLR